ncbi:hypothetical protein GALMADRAFT_223554 [Galerina marginata CBS 339.88]|uniref:Uncharacterized protein n=1 Tax=Galerina marginata (strain CBS 339.88) TaxID=685588 RepID=A0A067T840_GALM3|nr:hypothetical protein GALMADRAFT_223554 [Galerina marginata CBS 339.88]
MAHIACLPAPSLSPVSLILINIEILTRQPSEERPMRCPAIDRGILAIPGLDIGDKTGFVAVSHTQVPRPRRCDPLASLDKIDKDYAGR